MKKEGGPHAPATTIPPPKSETQRDIWLEMETQLGGKSGPLTGEMAQRISREASRRRNEIDSQLQALAADPNNSEEAIQALKSQKRQLAKVLDTVKEIAKPGTQNADAAEVVANVRIANSNFDSLLPQSSTEANPAPETAPAVPVSLNDAPEGSDSASTPANPATASGRAKARQVRGKGKSAAKDTVSEGGAVPGGGETADTHEEKIAPMRKAVEELKVLGKTGNDEEDAENAPAKPKKPSKKASKKKDEGEPAKTKEEIESERIAAQKIEISAQQERIIALARSTRGEEYAKEIETSLKKGLSTSPEFYLESAERAEEMLIAEQEYLKQSTEFHKHKGFHKVLLDKFIDTDKRMSPEELRDLKENWQKARAEYLGFMGDSVEDRFAERAEILKEKHGVEIDGVLEKDSVIGKKGDSRKELLMKRYERRFGAKLIKEVYLDAEKAETDARINALESRDKGIFEKLYDGYMKAPPYIRVPATYAVIAVGSAIVGAFGGAIALLPMVITGASVAVQTGLYSAAAFQKNPEMKRRLNMIAMYAGVAGFLGLAGGGVIREFHRLLGTKENADNTLSTNASVTGTGDPDIHLAFMKERAKAQAAIQNIERQAAVAGTATALVGGAMVGHHFSQHGPVVHTGHDGVSVTTGHGAHHGSTHHDSGNGFLGIKKWWPFGNNHHDANVVKGPDALHPGSVAAHHAAESMQIHGSINDADKLVGHFGEQLQKSFHGDAHPPASVAKLFEILHTKDGASLLHGEDHATGLLGLQGEHGSALMHNGDTISLDDHSRIVITPAGHPDQVHVLIDDKGVLHKLTEADWKFRGVHVHEAGNQVHLNHGTPLITMENPTVTLSSDVSDTIPGLPTHLEQLDGTIVNVGPDHQPVPYVSSETSTTSSTYEAPAAHSNPQSLTLEQTMGQGAAPHAAVAEQPATGHPLTLEDTMREVPLQSPFDASWHTGDPIPLEPSVFTLPGSETYFAHADTVAHSQQLAEAFAKSHPNTVVMFDNTEIGPNGSLGEPRVGSIAFDTFGRLKDHVEKVADQSGRPWDMPDSKTFTGRLTYTP